MPSFFKRSLFAQTAWFPPHSRRARRAVRCGCVPPLPAGKKISQATRRIYIVALYLQQDEAGQEIYDALHAAKAARPELDIVVVVDWLRAQRGLIGAGKQPGNSAWYQAMTQSHASEVPVYGVPVQTRELFGVLHLKGFVIDDSVLYSGASLNNVYLHKFDKYRFDRYHLIHSKPLADSMQHLVEHGLVASKAVHRLDLPNPPTTRSLRNDIGDLRSRLKHATYRHHSRAVAQWPPVSQPVARRRQEQPAEPGDPGADRQRPAATDHLHAVLQSAIGGHARDQPCPGAWREDRHHRR